jgi:DnaK suppressor protein
MTDRPGGLGADLTDEFRRRLLLARAALLRTVVRTDEELATLEAHQAGAFAEDVATTEAAALLSRLEGRQKHALDEIEDALGRLESGTFGLCERCTQAISLARLRAMPEARLCVACRTREEGA